MNTRTRRVALFSHDSQGLGHVRRNIEIAAALVRADDDVECLLISGAPRATALALPTRTRMVTIPAVRKDKDGSYLSHRRDRTLAQTLAERGEATRAALAEFAPDAVIVDKHPRGLQGELDAALAELDARRADGGGPAMILGLRDILDDPATTRAEWDRDRITEAVLAHYDEVWVYGDPQVHDPVSAYDLPAAVAERVRHTGYLSLGRGGGMTASTPVPAQPFVLGLVGGGQDGAELARAFGAAWSPRGYLRVLVTGPYMDPAVLTQLQRRADATGDLLVLPFVPSTLPLVRAARAIVTMGGYNTVCEVLATGAPTLVVPRVRPRLEQAIRAERLAAATDLQTLHPARADAVTIGDWLEDAVARGRRPHPIDLDGLQQLPQLVASAIRTRQEAPRAHV